jgi:NADPH-dependent 2,4-dienoyl-CoA reductase/sulfur reductase-like enzyme
MAAALRARRHRSDLKITVIEKSQRIAIANCSIPAYLDGTFEDVNVLQRLSTADARNIHELDVLIGHSATRILPIQHTLSLENLTTGQSFDLHYDRLILSTGAEPIRPRWPNIGAKGVFSLRTLEDAHSLRHFLETDKPKNFVIIGTGTIAQACCAALHSYGMNVTMIGKSEGLMDDLEKPISDSICETLNDHDINLYFTDNLIGIKVSLDNKAVGVEASSNIIAADGVLLAMGVKPNVDLALSSDISLSIDNAILVDRHLMTSRQGIYACGDCAVTKNRITNKPIYWPLAKTAARQGRLAGENASGGNVFDPGTLASRFWTCFDLLIGRIGLSTKQAREHGFKIDTTSVRAFTKPRLFGGKAIDLVLISSRDNGRILGAQMAGPQGVHACFNTLVTAIEGKMTLRELENLDLGYTPEISSLWDPVQIAGRLGERKRR